MNRRPGSDPRFVAVAILLSTVFVAALNGCSGTDDAERREARADSVAVDSSMAGMDHSAMESVDSAGDMAAMDHSSMPGMGGAPSGASNIDMAAMDHSNMPGTGGASNGTSRGDMAGMDHSNMPGMAAPGARPSQNAMAGMDHGAMSSPGAGSGAADAAMDHANMPGMAPAATSADVKIEMLVEELTRDPIVQQRIQADTALRRLWQDASLRNRITN